MNNNNLSDFGQYVKLNYLNYVIDKIALFPYIVQVPRIFRTQSPLA